MSSTQFRAVTIDVEGRAQAVEWGTSGGTLRHLQTAVGGDVDVVPLHELVDMWVNDNGITEGQPVNVVATRIARGFGGTVQPYFGPVVFTGGADAEGATLPLTEEAAGVLVRLAEQALADLAG